MHERRMAACGRTVALACFLALAGRIALGEEPSVRDEIRKTLDEAKKAFRGELDRMLDQGGNELVGEISRRFESRVKDLTDRVKVLESEVAKRDRTIAELEAKVRELSGGKPAPAKPTPEPGPSGPAFLGVGHLPVPAAVRERFGLAGGTIVTRVMPGTPAADAGIKPGDILVQVGGKDIETDTLAKVVAEHKPGEVVELKLIRDGERTTAKVTLGDRSKLVQPQPEAPVAPVVPKEAPRAPVLLGIEIEEEGSGVVVRAVDHGFTGHVAGLRAGDRLVEVAGKPVTTAESVVEGLQGVMAGDELTLVYLRGDERVDAKVVGAHGPGGARLVSRRTSSASPLAPAAPSTRGFLGVAVTLAEGSGGAVVDSVVAGSPAEKAGIQKGDVIQKVQGQEIPGGEKLREVLSGLSAGDKVKIVVLRDGKTVELPEVALGAAEGAAAESVKPMPVEEPKTAPEAKPPEEPKPATPEKPRAPGRLGVNAVMSPDGIVSVKTVFGGSAAEKAGLKEGDVIVEALDKPIKSLDDLSAVLGGLGAGDQLKLKIRRGEETKDVTVELGGPFDDEGLDS